jgi:hypothetical protein
MARLFGREYTKQELKKYCGNIHQIAGIGEFECCTGKARGMRIYRVRNGNGLEFDLMSDKALDIARLSYKGINFSWLAKNGLHSSQYAYPVLNEFDRYFNGGMLLTCGLKNTGPDYIDSFGRFQHLHGRIGVTPCEQSWAYTNWDDEDLQLISGAITRDSMLGSHNLTLKRSIKTTTSKNEIEIIDEMENHEAEETDYVILYHFNFGFPFITENTLLKFPNCIVPVKARNEDAQSGIDKWRELGKPVDNFAEHVFFHKPESVNGWCTVSMENKDLGVGVYLTYH